MKREKLTFRCKKSKAVLDWAVAKQGALWDLRSESNSIFRIIEVLIRLCITDFHLFITKCVQTRNLTSVAHTERLWGRRHQHEQLMRTHIEQRIGGVKWFHVCSFTVSNGFIPKHVNQIFHIQTCSLLSTCRRRIETGSTALPSQKWAVTSEKPVIIYFDQPLFALLWGEWWSDGEGVTW